MRNNNPLAPVKLVDVPKVAKAQNAILRAYRRLSRKGVFNTQTGRMMHGWRGVGFILRVNHRYAWDLALNGVVPKNPEIRVKLGLPRVLPSERPAKRVREPIPKVWESPERYFKKVAK